MLTPVLLLVFATTYAMALWGGDLEFINQHLGILGAQILVSVLSLTIVTVKLYAGRSRASTRRKTLMAMLCLFGGFYVYDHGESFETHGFYNLLIFLAIYTPLNLVLGLLYLLWCTIDNFVIYFAVGCIVSSLYITTSLFHYQRVFDQGVRQSFEYIPGECTWKGPNLPFVDLLPAGAQNFWAGPMHCKKTAEQDVHAEIDEHGVLQVQCDKPGARISIEVLPETRLWPLSDKGYPDTFNQRVIERTMRFPYIPSQPFVLNHTTQAVVVRCGSSSTIAMRVSPPVAKLPLYVPPPATDTRPEPGAHSNQPNRQRPNVIYLMFDAVSRRQFHRRMPRSARVFNSLHRPGTNRINEMFRFHSTGFNTNKNTQAMYLGETKPSQRDTLPIWAYFRDRGYITARVESSCDDWARSVNGRNYRSKQFAVSERSLDYEFSSPFCLPEFFPNHGNPFGNFKGPYSITARCLFGRHVHEWGFDYLYKLRHELRNRDPESSDRRPYMVSAVFLEGHEGTGEVLRTADNALAEFLEELRDSGDLEDTVVMVGADHGLHMGLNFLFLQNGRIEHQNPFLLTSVPEWLYQHAQEHPGHNETMNPLDVNEQRLVVPVQVYHTFRVLADWPDYNPRNWQQSLLFPQKKGQTCDELRIRPGLCMCTH